MEKEEKARAEWNEIKDSNNQTVLQSFIARYPDLTLTQTAQSRLQTLLVRTAQIELSRLGCLSGDADGTLNAATQAGIKSYFKNYRSRPGRREPEIAITESFVSELRAQHTRICPLDCPAGQTANGSTCVVDKKPSNPNVGRQEEQKPTIPRRPRSKQEVAQPRPRAHQEASAPTPPHSGGGGGGSTTSGIGF